MPWDLAVDPNTGDLLLAPNNDFDVRTGPQVAEQRIRTRLRIPQGEWALDPTPGTLGSRLHEAFRLPAWRAQQESALMIREALEPMEDIQVRDVNVAMDEKDSRKLNVLIQFMPIEADATDAADELIFTTTLAG